MRKVLLIFSSLFVIFTLNSFSPACTDFRVTAKDGSMLIVRSMEFAQDLQSHIRTSNRNRAFSVNTPNGKPGLNWKTKYGYIYLDAMSQDVAVDGMNETGLTVEALYLPGETEYQKIPVGGEGRALPYTLFVDWVLGNFKSVDEIRIGLNNVWVYAQMLPGMGNTIFPLHYAIYDAAGNSIVVEFVKGKMNIYDNKVGILTNSPTYDWHIADLRNYVNLSAYNPDPVTAGKLVFLATGQGSGAVGLPGDASPPSRFIKIAFMLKYVYVVQNGEEALNVGQHIINDVDIPKGFVRAVSNGKESSDYTQWVVFKDIKHKILYFRTYHDLTLRQISLDKLDFSPNAPRLNMSLGDTPYSINVTDKLIGSKDQS